MVPFPISSHVCIFKHVCTYPLDNVLTHEFIYFTHESVYLSTGMWISIYPGAHVLVYGIMYLPIGVVGNYFHECNIFEYMHLHITVSISPIRQCELFHSVVPVSVYLPMTPMNYFVCDKCIDS